MNLTSQVSVKSGPNQQFLILKISFYITFMVVSFGECWLCNFSITNKLEIDYQMVTFT